MTVPLSLGKNVLKYEFFQRTGVQEFLCFASDPLLLLDDAAQGPLVPLVEVDLLPIGVYAHFVRSIKCFTGFQASSISIEGLKM